MDGDATEYGYNIALTFKPVKELTLAATYRSEIDLGMDGDVSLAASESSGGSIPEGAYVGSGSVSLPIPAVLTLAAAYTVEKVTFEFVYERSYWTANERLDFEYPVNLVHPVLIAAFDDPITKNWDDVDAYKFGLTYLWSPKLSLMAGGGIYGNPVPDATIAFDLPDSDSWFASLGFRYRHSEKLSYGAAYLHAEKEDRTAADDLGIVDGTFSGAASNLLAFSLTYLF
jgi:long-chain fatty acid transport protein